VPVPVSPVPWEESLIWLAVLAVVSFLVTWVSADKLRMRRTPYIAVLTVVTAAMTAGYLAWVDVSVTSVLTTHWAWGLIAAPLCGAFLIIGMTKLPVAQRLTGRRLRLALLWEAVVYGTTEGVLLSALPVLMTWQMIHSLGWPGTGGAIARWTLPAGYLVTASPIAPTLAHVLSHATSLVHGAELPPHPHRAPRSAPSRSSRGWRERGCLPGLRRPRRTVRSQDVAVTTAVVKGGEVDVHHHAGAV
jgi:hypothetical protein